MASWQEIDFDSLKHCTSVLDQINDSDYNLCSTTELNSHTSKTPVKNQASHKSLKKLYDRVNQIQPEKLDEELRRRNLSTRGELGIRRCRLQHHLKLELMFECENPLNMIEQPFDYIAVLDFEATCEENAGKNYQNEIIEFPIVLIDVKQQAIIDKFHSYCQPAIKPILSKFCTQLTGIKQRQVDDAPLFFDVLHNVETWLYERNLLSSTKQHKFAFATDGPWDFRNFLQIQCRLSSIPYPSWAEQWIDIRKGFAEFYSVKRTGINKMLHKLGLDFDGRPHSGIDDAINIARITVELLKEGCVLSFNDGIHKSSSEHAANAEVNEKDRVVFED
ncbi:unnamed protein product [Adineta steineri]|uniref:Exonuclease domain-containing protein n=2 Tax=Adineta steineri TaxID=433720 RepID=A0A815BSW3_9BILA|nr:unnamed protein product [Adineta steineri]CAF3687224.1 unnamed protein product [Adineta steineri]